MWETIPELTKGLRDWGAPHAAAFLGAAAVPEAVVGEAVGEAVGEVVGEAAACAPVFNCATRGEALCLLLDVTLRQTRLEYGDTSTDVAEIEELRAWLYEATSKPSVV